jgi:steroid 5-alpha reductase family enzyme
MAVLVTAWGARLTFNFARKGGYSGVEDYRWAICARMSPVLFQVFNLLFIVLYQMTLLVLITLPAAMARTHPAPLTAADVIITVLFVGFSSARASPISSSGTSTRRSTRCADGFLTTGLFAYSRHPNFFFEQAQWWAFYAFGATAPSPPEAAWAA